MATDDWTEFRIRPGALFLVGDPKQAIYRFRGADVAAYVQARDAFLAQDADSVLSISTNFRSCAPILTYRQRALRGPALERRAAGLHRARPVPSTIAATACASPPSTSPWPMKTARPAPSSNVTAKPTPSPSCAHA